MSKLLVEEFTTPGPITAPQDMLFQDLVTLMQENEIRHIPVVENNMPVGLISERDLLKYSDHPNRQTLSAKDIMHAKPYCVDSQTPIEKVTFTMSSRKIGSALVTDGNGELVGIFTSIDAMNALVEIARGEVSV